MLKDYEIAQKNEIKNIKEIASVAGIAEENLEMYGNYKAKINKKCDWNPSSKIILVTSMNPTPYGEGKTTVAIGLHDALRRKGVSSLLTLREPSLGPVFGIKGGATGGGYAQVVPMEDINLHFTGDFHAITTANNLISAMIDNSLYQDNPLNLDKDKIYFTRTMDMNDRALRNIEVGVGGGTNGIERKEKFTITAACEIMSTLCLASDLEDLRNRLDKIIIGKNLQDEYVYVKDLGITGSLLALLKDAMKPNLVQTLEKNPVIIHGGPFANIAPGCNSVSALKLATSLSNLVITEAGFGFDLGGFKFIDILSRINQFNVSGIVFVVTLKAIKHHANNDELSEIEKIKKGFSNVEAHLKNLELLQIPYVITLNKYTDDTEEEINTLKDLLTPFNKEVVINNVYELGGEGALDLAEEVLKLDNKEMHYLYDINAPLKEKIETVCQKLLHAKEVEYSDVALEKIKDAEKLEPMPICIAKTQYSISDDPKKLGDPEDYTVTVKDIRVYNGAGFITIYLGSIMTMPGLSKTPAALSIDVNNDKIINIY